MLQYCCSTFFSLMACFFLILTSFHGIVEGQNPLFEKYWSKTTHKIMGMTDNPLNQSILILLKNGTLWHCHYKTAAEKKCVLKKWKIDQEIWIWRNSGDSDGFYRLWSYSDKENSYVELIATIDPTTSLLLPTIVETTNGHIILTDGSEWKEDSWIVSGFSYWKKDDRIIVSHKGNGYCLINLDQTGGLIYNTDYTPAILIDYRP